MRIKELCTDERPREKLLLRGVSALGSAELLAILIGSGTGGRNAVEVGQELLREAGGKLREVSAMSVDRLCRVKGIGKARGVAITAAMELGRRAFQEEAPARKVTIKNARQVYRMMLPLTRGLSHEECWVLFLNRRNYLLGREKITVGDGSQTLVDVRRILRSALDKGASAVILLHNHPSGDPRPGEKDLVETRRLKSALNAFHIDLLDHIVLSDSSFFSFSEDTVTP